MSAATFFSRTAALYGSPQPTERPAPKRRWGPILRTAAAVAAGVVVTLFAVRPDAAPTPSPARQEFCAFGGKSLAHLTDGSTVWLQSGSTLAYDSSFGAESRNVKLRGEGFFDIAKDPERPFTVEISGLKVRVHGTRFNIRTLPASGEVLISLLEGSVALDTAVSTLVIIFVAEFLPKSIFKNNPNFYYRALAPAIYFFYILLYPLARFTTLLSHGILRLLGRRVKEQDITPSFNREDLAALLEANNTEQHAEPDNELKLFQNALDFADLRVRDCMVPRVDIEAVDIEETSIGQLTARFVDSKYSRIFVWRGSIDNIVGYVNSKSLFTRPAQVADVMMEVNFVPETMPLQSVLENFIKHRSNIAVVIDEFGGTAGVISLEDVLEQIFGEIEDEHDIPDLTEKRVGEDEYVLSCRLEVKYLNEKYGLGIEESREYDTLAGFIIYNYEGIPSAGETVVIGDLQLRILRTTRSRIELARVKRL